MLLKNKGSMSNFGVYPKIEKRMKSQKRSWKKFCDLFIYQKSSPVVAFAE